MVDPLFAISVTAAAVALGGVWLGVIGMMPRQIRLDDAFAMLAGTQSQPAKQAGPRLVTDQNSRLELLGAWLYQHARLPLPAASARTLVLQGRSVGDYVINKLLLACLGLAGPPVLNLALGWLLPWLGWLPLAAGLLAGGLGWWWPDLMLRRTRALTNSDAQEALTTFFDLVILERLANLSATQALEAAANVSDIPVFVSIRRGLEQARLEQRPPWSDLQQLSRELELPQIADIVDVMRLDEQGAALADVLLARVGELRDANLNRERIAAHAVSERMTLWMAIPVVIFAMAFLVPPLLRIAQGG